MLVERKSEDDDQSGQDPGTSVANDNEPVATDTLPTRGAPAQPIDPSDPSLGGAPDRPSDAVEAGGDDASSSQDFVDDGPGDEDPAEDGPGDSDTDGADVATRLAEIAGEDPTILQAAHDVLVQLGAHCDPDNCAAMQKAWFGDDLAKVAPRIDALERRLARQADLLERIAATPSPPRTAANGRAFGKSDDADPDAAGGGLSTAVLEKALAALTPDERAFLLMKASLRQPIPLG